jgi:hypothetical protein
VSKQPQRAPGSGPMGSWAFTDAARPPVQRTLLKLIPCTSSAASGSPAPLMTPRDTSAERLLGGVLTCHRRHAPASGLGESTRCPGRVFSPVWSGTFGRRDGLGASAPPRPRRPMGETPGPSAAEIRTYLKALAKSTCQLVSWLVNLRRLLDGVDFEDCVFYLGVTTVQARAYETLAGKRKTSCCHYSSCRRAWAPSRGRVDRSLARGHATGSGTRSRTR